MNADKVHCGLHQPSGVMEAACLCTWQQDDEEAVQRANATRLSTIFHYYGFEITIFRIFGFSGYCGFKLVTVRDFLSQASRKKVHPSQLLEVYVMHRSIIKASFFHGPTQKGAPNPLQRHLSISVGVRPQR